MESCILGGKPIFTSLCANDHVAGKAPLSCGGTNGYFREGVTILTKGLMSARYHFALCTSGKTLLDRIT